MKVVFLELQLTVRYFRNCTYQEKAGDDKEEIDKMSPVKAAAVEVDPVVDEDVKDLLIVMQDQYDRGRKSQEINCSVSAFRVHGVSFSKISFSASAANVNFITFAHNTASAEIDKQSVKKYNREYII